MIISQQIIGTVQLTTITHLCTYPVVEHSNDTGTLGVGDGVKDLLHLRWGTNRNLNTQKQCEFRKSFMPWCTIGLWCSGTFIDTKTCLDWVRIGEGIKAHSTGVLTTQEVSPDIVLWVGVVNAQVLDPGSKTLI